jgi:hypothetical protein
MQARASSGKASTCGQAPEMHSTPERGRGPARCGVVQVAPASANVPCAWEVHMARAARNYMKPSRRRKNLTRRDCLRCDQAFWSEGPHHRLCQACRQSIAASPSPVEEYSIVSVHERGVPDTGHSGRGWRS